MLTPSSDTSVSYPIAIDSMVSWMHAWVAACLSRSQSTSGSKHVMFWASVPASSWSSCMMTPAILRMSSMCSVRMLTPPMNTSPLTGRSIPVSSFSTVVLPHPDGPTTATDCPSGMVSDRSFRIHGSCSE